MSSELPNYTLSDKVGQAVLIVCAFAFFTVMTGRIIVSPVVPNITQAFQVSNAVIGVALTAMWAAYALAQFPSGVLGDSYGERSVIVVSMALIVTSVALLAISPTFALFVVALVLLGASCGLYYTVATSLLAKLYRNTGRAIGIHAAGGQIGGIVAPVAISFVAVRYGWRWGVGFGILVGVPVLLAALRVLPRTSDGADDELLTERFTPGEIRRALTRPAIASLTLISIFGWFGFQATLSFLPTFLVRYHDVSVGMAGILFSVFFGAVAVSMVTAGDLSDRFGRTRLLFVVFATGAASTIVLVTWGSFVAIVAGVVLLGVGMSWLIPMEAWIMDIVVDEERGTVFGLVRTVFMVFGALGSSVVGTVADVMGWAPAILVVGLLLAIGAAMLLVVHHFDIEGQ